MQAGTCKRQRCSILPDKRSAISGQSQNDGGWDLDVDQYIGVMVEFFTTDIEDPKAVLNGLTLRPAYPNP
ncbi:MAG: hypothetical protein AAFQ87_15075, partial [Bacteroidota bacterium]